MSMQFPDLIRSLPVFDGPFDAFKLESESFKVLFASYPAGTDIPAHQHDTENVGVVTPGLPAVVHRGRNPTVRARRLVSPGCPAATCG